MQIIIHTGAHFTDDDRLLKSLLRNKAEFTARGTAVPGPGKYRQLLRSTLNAMRHAAPEPDARDVLMDAILDDETPDRMILSNAHFFGVANTALRNGVLYPAAPERLANLVRLFPGDALQMHMAIRNPASFLPLVLEKSLEPDMSGLLGGHDPRSILWSDMLLALRAAAPDVPITVWCNEDTPLIWGDILRDMAGVDPELKIAGAFDLLKTIITREGMRRFRAYLAAHPTLNVAQKRKVIAAFLDKYAVPDEIEQELDIPGWNEDLVEELTDLYDDDLLSIQEIPGVRVLAP